VCGLAAAWVAAGDAGLMAHSLCHALVLVMMAAALAASWPERRDWRVIATLAALVSAAVIMVAAPLAPINVLAVAVFMAGLSAGRAGADRRILLAASQAVAVFGLYRVAVTSVPALWMAADLLGGGIGRLAGAITGHPTDIGPSFAGIDELVLAAAFCGLWLAATPRPRIARGLIAAAGILAAQFIYLGVLSYAPLMVGGFPEPAPDAPWSYSSAVRTLLPWNLPAIAVILQSLVAGVMLRWGPPPSVADEGAAGGSRRAALVIAGAVIAAALLPIATVLYPAPPSLEGKRIVLYEKGFGVGDWTRPTHGDYGHMSVGMYGMLPDFIRSLGAEAVKSPDLSATDLDGASTVILIYPDKPWTPGQLDRLWAFVRRGGSLLVFGEHTVREADGGARFNDVLEPTAMRVGFDAAEWAVGGWLECYETQAHPTTAGRRTDRNDLGVVIGASVKFAWPARPLILGRWGWADEGDPGSPRAMLGNNCYDAGERLGDVCLAAEQTLGDGKIIVFGDPSSIANGVSTAAHDFVSSLLAYAASPGPAAPQWWWSVVGFISAGVAAVLIVLRPRAWPAVAAAVAAAASLLLCTADTHRLNFVPPDGRRQSPNNLAYIDMSHLGAFSEEGLREEGLLGLELTLMRSGFMTLDLDDFRPEALGGAGLLISVAPARAFSTAEREALRTFVEGGGVFVCTVGYDSSAAAAPMLADFGFRIGEPDHPDKSPSPLGWFKTGYPGSDGKVHFVRFNAAWPVSDEAAAGRGPAAGKLPPAYPVAIGAGGAPVIAVRPVGKGKFVVIGDACFAMNKNLENMDGSPTEGLRENADFWRWFLTHLRNQPEWIPPEPVPQPPTAVPADAAPQGATPTAPAHAHDM
jgi:hypothetical protein